MNFGTSGRTTALVAAALIGGATSVAAEEKIGEIFATIDGEAFEWRALAPDADGTDYNTSLRFFGPMQNVSVMGFSPGQISMKQTIQITFTLTPGSLDTFEQEVIYAPEGMKRMWTSLPDDDLVTVESFEDTDAGGEVSGRFSGRLCLKESMFAEPDPDQCKDIEGSFASSLPEATI